MIYIVCNVLISGAWEGAYELTVDLCIYCTHFFMRGLSVCVHDTGGKGCKCEYLDQQ